MKAIAALLVLLSGFGVALCWFVSTPSVVASAQSSPRWEYAEMSSGATIRVELPGVVHETSTYPEMIKKFGGTSARTDSTALLNTLGAQGWELVTQTGIPMVPGYSATTTYWTLRRRR